MSNNSVVIPLDHLIELESSAYANQTPMTASQRVAGTVQTTIVFAALSGACVAGAWGWAKAQDWLEEKQFQRKMREKSNITPK